MYARTLVAFRILQIWPNGAVKLHIVIFLGYPLCGGPPLALTIFIAEVAKELIILCT